MKKILTLALLIILLLPIETVTFAETGGITNNLNNSNTVDSIEKTRQSNNNTSFDEFIEKVRKPSIPIGITLISLAGLMFLLGFWIKPLQKIAGALLAGVIFGLFFINYGEYAVGWMLALFDALVEYF